MKIITPSQRDLNILNKAVANGFEINSQDTFEEVRNAATDFLIENEIDVKEEQVEVKSLGNHGQRVDWSDEFGFEFWSQGEIVDFKSHWHDAPGTKVFHETCVDSEANVIKMYYLVAETEYNQK
jgi:hypothetical protein